MTTPTGQPDRARGVFDRRAVILTAVSVAVGVFAVAVGNWLVFAAMVLSVAFQVVGLWLRYRRLNGRSTS